MMEIDEVDAGPQQQKNEHGEEIHPLLSPTEKEVARTHGSRDTPSRFQEL